MAMGVPLICNSGVGDTAEIVKKFNCGGVIDTFNPEQYDRAFKDVQNVQASSGIEGAKSFYDLNDGVEKYFSVYQRIWTKK